MSNFIIALKFNNHKDIHIMQDTGELITSKQAAEELAIKIMDERIVFTYEKEDGTKIKSVMNELEAIKKKYKYLLPYGFEIYESVIKPDKMKDMTEDIFKGN